MALDSRHTVKLLIFGRNSWIITQSDADGVIVRRINKGNNIF